MDIISAIMAAIAAAFGFESQGWVSKESQGW